MPYESHRSTQSDRHTKTQNYAHTHTQGSFRGRLFHFCDVIDPRTLFTSKAFFVVFDVAFSSLVDILTVVLK